MNAKQHIGTSYALVVAERRLDQYVGPACHGLGYPAKPVVIELAVAEVEYGMTERAKILDVGALVRFAALSKRRWEPRDKLRWRPALLRNVEIQRRQMATGDMVSQIRRRQPDSIRD